MLVRTKDGSIKHETIKAKICLAWSNNYSFIRTKATVNKLTYDLKRKCTFANVKKFDTCKILPDISNELYEKRSFDELQEKIKTCRSNLSVYKKKRLETIERKKLILKRMESLTKKLIETNKSCRNYEIMIRGYRKDLKKLHKDQH